MQPIPPGSALLSGNTGFKKYKGISSFYMRIGKRHLFLLLLAILCLLLGVLNYFLLQPDIVLFRFLSINNNHLLQIHPHWLYIFLSGYFSDTMWCTALCLVVLVLSDLKYLNTIGKLITLLLPFLSEAAQYFGFIRGTFDWYDILTYGIIVMAFSLLSSLFKN